MSRLILVLPVLLAAAFTSGAAATTPPFTLEELFKPPYPYGVSARAVCISDDGAYLACAWSEKGQATRNLWTYCRKTGVWSQHTDLWPDREARLRREFSRDLAREREQWDEEHTPPDEGEAGAADAAADNEDAAAEATEEVAAEDEAEEFDEAERIEEFEEDLDKQRDTYHGIGQVIFRKDSHEVFWSAAGALYSMDLDEEMPEPMERLRHEAGFFYHSTIDDADIMLFDSGSDLMLYYPADGRIRQLTSGGHGDKPNTEGYAINSDARLLAYSSRDYSRVRKTGMPELLADDPYMTQHRQVRPADTPETVSLTVLDLEETPPWPVEVELGDEPFYQIETLDWSPVPGDDRLLVGVITGDTEHYKAYLVELPADDLDKPEVRLLYDEHDSAWINWARTSVMWAYDGELLLQSEKDGVANIYRLVERDVTPEGDAEAQAAEDAAETGDPATHEAVPLIAGPEEVVWVRPLKHSPHYIFASDNGLHRQRNLYLGSLDGSEPVRIGDAGGWRGGVSLSRDERLIAFTAAGTREMGQLRLCEIDPENMTAGAEQQILNRLPDNDGGRKWAAWTDSWDVRYIDVPAAEFPEYEDIYRDSGIIDEASIAVKLWLPPDWSPECSYPLLIWIHGAGYAQTVAEEPGWLELFHPWVAEAYGWIVAEVDYRGSAGYGRDWRIDVAGRLGHPETDDLVAVKRHLVDNYGAEAERTALWGWSYGGFQTLMALGLAPGEFPVGCAVAPVNRWENYYYWYSTCRLGHPDENEEAYERSAAETYLGNVTDDLLIIHGLRDDNTLFQSIAQYFEKSHELGVNVELKLFPSDDHGIGNEFHFIRIYDTIVDYCHDHWPE